ncbi:MAG: SGNH/GDSL hydrolase family protein [Actinomycetota bacterium]
MPLDTLADPMGYLSARVKPTPPKTLIAIVGDSNCVGIGVADTADSRFAVGTPLAAVQYNTRYAASVGAGASNTYTDYPGFRTLTNLSLYAASGGQSMGFEMSLGPTLLARGMPAPVIVKHGVVGATLAVEMNPTGTYPAAGAGNLFNLQVAQLQAFQTSTGRSLGAIVVSAGTNDAANLGQANAFGANMGAWCTAMRAIFGSGLLIVWIKTNPDVVNANVNAPTVIAQQVAYAATDPLCILIDQADCPQVSDHLHDTANSSLTIGQRAGAAICDALGYTTTIGAAPQLIGVGPTGVSTTNPTAVSHGDQKNGDTEVLTVRTGYFAHGTVTTPSGWTPRGVTTDAASSGVTVGLTVFTRQVTTALLAASNGHMPPTTVTITGSTGNTATAWTVRGPNPNPTVDSITLTPSNSIGTGPVTVPAFTTSGPNRRVALMTGGFCGSAGTMTEANGTLAGFSERSDGAAGVAANFMIDTWADGTLAATGGSGTFSVSSSANTVQINAVIAFAP